MKNVLIIFIFVLLLFGCAKNEDVYDLIKDNEYTVIDVRTKEEYEKSHVKDAINIPYDQIDKNIGINKKNIVLVYCQSGNRSNIAYNTLKGLGFDVYDLGSIDSVELPIE